MKESLVEQHIGDKLVPTCRQDVSRCDGDDDQDTDGGHRVVCVGQDEDDPRADQLRAGEQELVTHLIVEVVIDVVPDRPPGVVVRVDGCQEEDGEPPSQFA